MSLLLLSAFAFVTLVLLGTVVFASLCAQNGYEDDLGFHRDSRMSR